MVSKRKVLEKTKHLKIEQIEQKEKIIQEQRRFSRILIWIIVILVIASASELVLLFLR